MKEEIEKALEKLPKKDRELVITYIKNHESRIKQLEGNLRNFNTLMKFIIVPNLQSIQTALDNISRELLRCQILRPRRERKIGS